MGIPAQDQTSSPDAEPGADPGAAYLRRGSVSRIGAPMASRASGVRAGTREWVSASRSPPCCFSRAAVIGPVRHVGGQRASLPAPGNPLPAPGQQRRLQGQGDDL